MTQHSRLRQQAEIAFTRTQSQLLARKRAVEELDATVQAHDDKTSRLRNARLGKELENRGRLTASLLAKRAITA
jgi:hypothetical protein